MITLGPKRSFAQVELHLHLDGSLAESFVLPRLAALGVPSPIGVAGESSLVCDNG